MRININYCKENDDPTHQPIENQYFYLLHCVCSYPISYSDICSSCSLFSPFLISDFQFLFSFSFLSYLIQRSLFVRNPKKELPVACVYIITAIIRVYFRMLMFTNGVMSSSLSFSTEYVFFLCVLFKSRIVFLFHRRCWLLHTHTVLFFPSFFCTLQIC